MALTKIKLNEVETKADPVLADGVLLSDSADGGRGKISTLTDLQTLIGGGGGAVDSVAGKTGDVTLDADDVSETATKLWMSDTQQSIIEGLSDALAAKAPLASPALTGTPTAPTAAVGTNTTQIATTAFCGNFNQKWTYSSAEDGGYISASAWTMHGFGANGTLNVPQAATVAPGVQVAAIVVDSGAEVVLTTSWFDQFVTPSGLATTYTLKGNGSSIVLVRVTNNAWACVGAPDSLINAAIAAAKVSPALTGTPTAPTAAEGTNTTQIATTEFVQDALAEISMDADPYSVKITGDQSIAGVKTFTSSPVIPTPTAGDNTTKAATTAFVQAAVAGVTPGGAVDSVAGKTGVVTLDASDIAETSALKIMTADERTKLTGIAEGANNYTHPETHPQSMIEGLSDALAAKAPLASPALTGTPTAPTAATGTNTTQIATTAFCGNYNQKWTYSYGGGATNAAAWTMHAFGANGTLTLPLASTVASGVQVAAIVAAGGAEVVITRSGSDQFVTPTGLATTYTLRGNGSSIVLVRATASAWVCVGAPDSLINAATASAIYDLPVTRRGLVSAGTDSIIFETANAIDPSWYDETHVLNISFFARNDTGSADVSTFNFQLYDETTSTAYTVASLTGVNTKFPYIMQASLFRSSSGTVNCAAKFFAAANIGSVSLASGSYKLRVVCTSTLSIEFYAAQVRFTK